MTTTVPITYPPLKKELVPVQQTAVERSLARPDAFSKPGSIGKTGNSKVRVRTTSGKIKGAKKRRYYRNVTFY